MRLLALLLAFSWVPAAAHAAGAERGNLPIDALERRALESPDSLRAAAEYRQAIIAAGAFDRAIAVFERVAKKPGAGAGTYINLALTYVDKVPVSGALRQVYLGRDAIRALTRSIELAPSPLAYFVRGLVNLYYDKLIFHRVDKGVADLEAAQKLAAVDASASVYLPRILLALGDGYFRLDQKDRARQIWRDALERFPDAGGLSARVGANDQQLRVIIGAALDADARVDTSLRELFPDLPLAAARSGSR